MNNFNPEKLSVTFRPYAAKTYPIIPRRYTLTHSDKTAELFLTIGSDFAWDELTEMRDEVLGEWYMTDDDFTFHVYLHVDDPTDPSRTAIRNQIFIRELPLALQAIYYGDRALFEKYPFLKEANIIAHFQSTNPTFNRFEYFGKWAEYAS